MTMDHSSAKSQGKLELANRRQFKHFLGQFLQAPHKFY